MKRVVLSVATVAAISAAFLTLASPEPDEDLNHFMSNATLAKDLFQGDVKSLSMARAYLVGVSDAGAGKIHCSPVDATTQQIVDAYMQTFTKYPAERNAARVVSDVLAKTWPCATT